MCVYNSHERKLLITIEALPLARTMNNCVHLVVRAVPRLVLALIAPVHAVLVCGYRDVQLNPVKNRRNCVVDIENIYFSRNIYFRKYIFIPRR